MEETSGFQIIWNSQEVDEIPSSQNEADGAMTRDTIEILKEKMRNGYVPRVVREASMVGQSENVVDQVQITAEELDENRQEVASDVQISSKVQFPILQSDLPPYVTFELPLSQSQGEKISPLVSSQIQKDIKGSVQKIQEFLNEDYQKDMHPPTPEHWAYQLSQTRYSQELNRTESEET